MSDDIQSNQRKADLAMVDEHVQALMEHFDCCHVFCTRHMPAEFDGTTMTNRGAGHWHARYGQIREWVIVEEERMREGARPDRI